MHRPMEKISTLLLKTQFRIGPQNVPRVLAIPTVPRCLAKPETVDLVSEALEDDQSKTQNLLLTTLNLGGGVVRVRSSERVVRAVKGHFQSDPGRARGWMQKLAGKIIFCGTRSCSCAPVPV